MKKKSIDSAQLLQQFFSYNFAMESLAFRSPQSRIEFQWSREILKEKLSLISYFVRHERFYRM